MIKRAWDLFVASVLLLLLGPLFGLVALAILLVMGRPVLFRQVRPGLKTKPFTLLKFRTMNEARDEQGYFLPDEERLTTLGRLLRRLSLDELPQLLNVWKGEMSLVGPRPLLTKYLDRYTSDQARRHDVKPGITGWAQVNGRNALTWPEKFALDLWYVDNWDFRLDARILFLTFWRVLKREGISCERYATMPEFLGTQETGATKCGK